MKILFLGALGATCLLVGVAQADLKWTEKMSMEGIGGPMSGPMGAGLSLETTQYMNDEAGRTDTKMQMGPISMLTHEVNLCPSKTTLNFFDEGKLYSESPLQIDGMAGMPPMPMMGGMPGMPGMPAGGGAPKTKKTGTQTIAYNLRDLGTEKILDVDTHHYALYTSIISTGCAGNGTVKTSIEVWKANFPMPAPCLATTFDGTVKSAARVRSDCDVKTTVQGDGKVAADVFNGFVMRLKMGVGKGTMTREVTMLSRAKLDDSVFAVPEGYTKVTQDELNKARQKAMMKSIMGGGMAGMTGMGGGGNDDNN